MLRLPLVLGLGILGLAFLVGTGTSQDKGEKKEPPKTKGQLPPGWAKLGLSNDQKKEIYGVMAKFKTKIKALEEQIKVLKTQERQEMAKVLTDEQKIALRKLVIGEDDPKKDKGKEKEKDKN